MSTNDRPLGRTLATGDTHHIERLMLLPSFCLLADVHPRAVTHWFLSAHGDDCDWVMQPNITGMGLNADGGLVASEPYVASAAYIHRISDYCGGSALPSVAPRARRRGRCSPGSSAPERGSGGGDRRPGGAPRHQRLGLGARPEALHATESARENPIGRNVVVTGGRPRTGAPRRRAGSERGRYASS